MTINQYERYKSKDGKRLFIVLGKWSLGKNDFSDYEVLDVFAEQAIRIPKAKFEGEIENGNLIQVKQS
jgi:hypothetical protein